MYKVPYWPVNMVPVLLVVPAATAVALVAEISWMPVTRGVAPWSLLSTLAEAVVPAVPLVMPPASTMLAVSLTNANGGSTGNSRSTFTSTSTKTCALVVLWS